MILEGNSGIMTENSLLYYLNVLNYPVSSETIIKIYLWTSTNG